MSHIFAIIAAVLSGILLWASFPPGNQAYLTWFGLVPLLIALKGKRLTGAFCLAYVCGLIFFFSHFHWINSVDNYKYLHHFLLGFYLSVYFGYFGLAFAYTASRLSFPSALLAAPFFWVALEYFRSNFSFLALPWGLLGHSQSQYPVLIQTSEFAGVYGVSFIIAASNTSIVSLYYLIKYRLAGPQKKLELQPMKGLVYIAILGLIIFFLSTIYGFIKTSKSMHGKTFKVALIQGNIEQSRKWDPAYAHEIIEIYKGLTRQALKKFPNLVVWPEAATPGSITRNRMLFKDITQLVDSADANLLLGSTHLQKFNVKHKESAKYSNSAFLLRPQINIKSIQRYDKIRLMPFGEYLPEKNTIPWDQIGVPEIDEFLPGDDYTIFKLDDMRFSTTICWENLIAEHVRKFVQNGAQLIINITNEAWFGKTPAPYQFLAMNVFRAVENGLYVVRCANTGISCIIDPCGRVVKRVRDNTGKDIFVRGYIGAEIYPRTRMTIYTTYGEWFVWLSMAVSLVSIVTGLMRDMRLSRIKRRET